MGRKSAIGSFGKYQIPSMALTYGRKHLYTQSFLATVNGNFIDMGFRYMMQ